MQAQKALLAREPVLSETLEVHVYHKGSEEEQASLTKLFKNEKDVFLF